MVSTDDKRALLDKLKYRARELTQELHELQMSARGVEDSCTERSEDALAAEARKLHLAAEEAGSILAAWDQ